MNTRFYGVIFRGKPERVESHRLKHLEALHFFEARIRIGRAVLIPMPYV